MLLIHPADCDGHDAALLNERVAQGLDMFGDAVSSLAEVAERVGSKLVRCGVVTTLVPC